MTIVSRATFDAEHPSSLAVYCSDGRYTDAVEELLHHLGHPRLDTLTIPGGAALLELTSASTAAAATARDAVEFLITGHHLGAVVLVAHAGCGYYRARFGHDSPASVERRQLSDLRSAARWLVSQHRGLDVHRYFARPAGARVTFEPVDP